MYCSSFSTRSSEGDDVDVGMGSTVIKMGAEGERPIRCLRVEFRTESIRNVDG